jgi:hypothetical protein
MAGLSNAHSALFGRVAAGKRGKMLSKQCPVVQLDGSRVSTGKTISRYLGGLSSPVRMRRRGAGIASRL